MRTVPVTEHKSNPAKIKSTNTVNTYISAVVLNSWVGRATVEGGGGGVCMTSGEMEFNECDLCKD